MQRTLFHMSHPDQPAVDFAGADYVAERDRARLTGQLERIFKVIADGAWRTLEQISVAADAPHASASAQLRNLRKIGHVIDRRHVGAGLYEYRLVK